MRPSRGGIGPVARRRLAALLTVLAALAVVLALVAGYVRRATVDSDQFANRATVALRDDSVRTLIADRITDDLVLRQHPDLIAARPLIGAIAGQIVGSRAFTGLFRRGVRDVHRAVFRRDRNTVTLTVADVGTVLAAGLQVVRPSLASQVESSRQVTLLRRDVGGVAAGAARVDRDLTLLWLVLSVLAVVLLAAALWVAPRRRGEVVRLGVALAVGGALLVLACRIGRLVAVGSVGGPAARAAVGAVYDAFLGDLRTAAWILAGAGAVVAAAAASLIRPVEIGEPLRGAARRVAREPARPAARVGWGVGVAVAGWLCIAHRDAVLAAIFTVAGVYLVYEGFAAVLKVVAPPARGREPGLELERVRGMAPSRRVLTTVGVALLAIGAAMAVFVGSGGTTTAAPPPVACNGHRELCGRPLARVALPATHNSMSVPLPGWYSAEQERPIPDQLRDGIRGLLIDTHYADRLPNGRLRTAADTAALRRRAKQEGLSPGAVDAALRIRDRLGFAGRGTRGIYLCHGFCELGGTPLDGVLEQLRAFLVANPGEIVVVVNQDEGVPPDDFVGAVRRAGLEPLAYGGPIDRRRPTLRQMVDRDRRVLFLAENRAGAAPWYRPVYASLVQETPFKFSRASQLTDPRGLPASCRANRGSSSAPLFLINHWITTTPVIRPSDARRVNAYRPLLRRVEDCRRLRHRFPNLITVNFYREGNLFRVVDRLNRVR